MGLGIKSLTVLEGLTTIENLYGHARDIRVTKDNQGLFEIQCDFIIYKNIGDKQVRVKYMHIYKKYNDDFLTKTWNDVYTIIKEDLTSKGIEYVDEI